MAWDGYYVYAGVEIINVARTETYARNANLGWFQPIFRNTALPQMLVETYSNPMQDSAPWVDLDDPASFDFFGLYPLQITGIEDSTVTAAITESTLDGGVVGRQRRATRAMVFSGILIAGSDCGAEYGQRWLRAVLGGGPCAGRTDRDCGGSELTYLRCEPELRD